MRWLLVLLAACKTVPVAAPMGFSPRIDVVDVVVAPPVCTPEDMNISYFGAEARPPIGRFTPPCDPALVADVRERIVSGLRAKGYRVVERDAPVVQVAMQITDWYTRVTLLLPIEGRRPRVATCLGRHYSFAAAGFLLDEDNAIVHEATACALKSFADPHGAIAPRPPATREGEAP